MRDSYGTAYLLMAGEKQAFSDVTCELTDPEPWTKVVPGQRVKVRGRCTFSEFGPKLQHGVLLETGPYLAVALSAEQLATEYDADPVATPDRYRGKHLLLSGEIAQKSVGSDGRAVIHLRGTGKTLVRCEFSSSERDFVKSMTVGQQLRVVGGFHIHSLSQELAMYGCYPVKQR
jgi:hypothetical protein